MQKKLQIFISSTYEDLKEERQAAVSAILKAGHIPAGMELFTSGDESQMETIKRWIDASDIYMLILGGRYGSVEPTTSLSYTELEYDYAVAKAIPFFAVVITDAALELKVKSVGSAVMETANPRELVAFRKKVLSKTSAFFSDVNGIRLAVYETINDFIARYAFKGWVSGEDVPDISAFLEQIDRLREENKRSLDEIESLKRELMQSEKRQDDEQSFEDLIKLLDETRLKTPLLVEGIKFRGGEGIQEGKDYTLLELLTSLGNALTTGIHNSSGMNALGTFCFFNLLPKLQMYGLANSESVNGVTWRRFALTPKGINLLGYINKIRPIKNEPEKDAE